MRSRSRMRGCATLMAAAALTGILAGCGSASDSAALAAAHPREPAHLGNQGPVAGSRRLAAASARQLLGLLELPAGSRHLPARPVPRGLDQPGVYAQGPGNFLDVDRLYRLPVTVADALAFLRAHVPPGAVASSASAESGGNGVTSTAIYATQRRVPAGIDEITLVETLVPGPGGSSLLRADAEVVWYPPRSAAEYLIAARFRSVRITMSSGTGAASVTGGQRLIGPLAAVLDSMHATPPLDYPCPLTRPYELVFAPAVHDQGTVVVQGGNCDADIVSVGGRPQAELFDTGRLSALVTRLLGDHAPARPGQ